MKIIRKQVISAFIEEMEVEKSILGFKYRRIYRRINCGNILRYKHPNDYVDTGLCEYTEMSSMFNIPYDGLTSAPSDDFIEQTKSTYP